MSPSRLLVASAALQAAPQAPGASVYSIAQASALSSRLAWNAGTAACTKSPQTRITHCALYYRLSMCQACCQRQLRSCEVQAQVAHEHHCRHAQARWHGEAVGTVSRTGDRAMQALYLRCSVQLRRAAAPPAIIDRRGPCDGQLKYSFRYELHISQDLEDGTYHDPDEEAQQETIAVQDIAGTPKT